MENNPYLNVTEAFSARRSTAPPGADKLPDHYTHCHTAWRLLCQIATASDLIGRSLRVGVLRLSYRLK
jgi:hypothetical protein